MDADSLVIIAAVGSDHRIAAHNADRAIGHANSRWMAARKVDRWVNSI